MVLLKSEVRDRGGADTVMVKTEDKESTPIME